MEPNQNGSGFVSSYSTSPEEPKIKLNWGKWLVGVALAVVGIFIYFYISFPLSVVVIGRGEVSVPATSALVSFTLSESDSSSPEQAILKADSKAKNLSGFLTSKGIAEGDIAKSQVTVVPASLIVAGATGYQATITMAVKTDHVSGVAALISDLYSRGVNVVSQPVLSVDDPGGLDKDAFDLAMTDAEAQVKRMGLSRGKLFRKIASISQANSASTSTSTTKADVLTTKNDPTAAENGVFKIAKEVSVTYKMW